MLILEKVTATRCKKQAHVRLRVQNGANRREAQPESGSQPHLGEGGQEGSLEECREPWALKEAQNLGRLQVAGQSREQVQRHLERDAPCSSPGWENTAEGSSAGERARELGQARSWWQGRDQTPMVASARWRA